MGVNNSIYVKTRFHKFPDVESHLSPDNFGYIYIFFFGFDELELRMVEILKQINGQIIVICMIPRHRAVHGAPKELCFLNVLFCF